MSKKDTAKPEADERPKEVNNKKEKDTETMTPWQKEHLLYLQKMGENETQDKKQDEKADQNQEDDQKAPEAKENEPLDEETEEADKTDALSDSYEADPSERVSFADRLPKIKTFRNKQLRRRLVFLTVLFLVPLLGTLYYVSPLAALSKVQVSGNQHISEQEIIKSSELTLHENLWKQYFTRKTNEKKIENSSVRIQKATISLTNFNQMQVQIKEYQEVALLSKDDLYYPIFENGEIAKEGTKEASEEKIIFEDFEKPKMILETLTEYNKLSNEIQQGISQMKLSPSKTNEELLTIYMNDGNEVIVNISNLSSQMTYYPQVAKEMDEKGVVDMEVGIFTYPYPDKKTEKEK